MKFGVVSVEWVKILSVLGVLGVLGGLGLGMAANAVTGEATVAPPASTAADRVHRPAKPAASHPPHGSARQASAPAHRAQRSQARNLTTVDAQSHIRSLKPRGQVPLAAGRLKEDFLALREAARLGEVKKIDRLAPRFKGHVLEPYVAYWQFRPHLSDQPAQKIREFLNQYQNTLVGEQLRRDWLKRLGSNQQWDVFEAEWPSVKAPDVELQCWLIQDRGQKEPSALLEARPLWFTDKETPESCHPLFATLVSRGDLSVADVWKRIRLNLVSGQVAMASRVANTYLSDKGSSEFINVSQWLSVAQNPMAQLSRLPTMDSRADRELMMFAAYRGSRVLARQAATQWQAMESTFSAEERGFVWGQIALHGALQHDPAALSWYARAIELNDMQLEWQARAALRAQDWKTLVAAIDRMAKDGLDPTWRYWKGRALKALGQVAQAQALFKPLAQEYNFYGQLAQEELGGQVTTPDVGFTPTTADIELMGKNPAIKRALALVAMGLKVEANREWMWAIRDFEDKQLLIAAQLAKQADFPDWAINTAEKTVTLHDFRLRYLTPYESSLKIQSQRQSLDEAWVLGLIRQESRFNPQSRSGAGAMGLMQLMPATAQWVAGKMGLNDWRQRGMMDVELNLMMGTYYLRHVHDFLDNSLVMASAAYNAGPNKVRTWRPERAMEAAVWVETIPFSETRRYVKVVMANASYYAHLLTQQPQSLRSRMGEVRPAPSDEKPLGDTP